MNLFPPLRTPPRTRPIEENIIRKDNLLIMKGCGHSIKNVPARSGGFQSIIPDDVLHLCAKGQRARRLSFSNAGRNLGDIKSYYEK